MDGYHRGMDEFRTNVLNRVEGKKVIALSNTPDNTRSAFLSCLLSLSLSLSLSLTSESLFPGYLGRW